MQKEKKKNILTFPKSQRFDTLSVLFSISTIVGTWTSPMPAQYSQRL